MFPQDQARADLHRARRTRELRDILAILRGQPRELLPFEWVRHLNPQGERWLGVRTIEVDRIIGSVDRYREFDRHYLPREKHLDDRWIGVRAAQLQGRELPPIQVYCVGDRYFVKDGNHRVSIARRQGQKFIDAEVIELSVSVPPEGTDTLKDIIIKGEYARFLKDTGLGRVVPDHVELLFTTPGRYERVLEHIRTRQYYLDRKPERGGLPPVTWEDAVRSWYERLYLRVVQELAEHDVMRRFPGRTEADLYLWIMDHRYFLTQAAGHDVGTEEATVDFSAHHAPPIYRRLGQRAKLLLRGQLHPAR